jgi:hypothetical protein
VQKLEAPGVGGKGGSSWHQASVICHLYSLTRLPLCDRQLSPPKRATAQKEESSENHRSASAAADCPACGGRYGRYRGYSSHAPYSYPSYSPSVSSGSGRSSGAGSGSSARPHWSPAASFVVYTPAEVRALTPVRDSVEKRVPLPEFRDVFLCHAWDDRSGAAKELHDLLESRGVSVWFSEKDVALPTPLLREIDKGWRSRESESCW